MFPDPVLAKERFGIDFNAIAELVDYFHVPLSSRDYLTNYWVDTIVRDFVATLKKPVVVEFSAEMPTDEKIDALLKTVAYISRHNLMQYCFLYMIQKTQDKLQSLLSTTVTSENGLQNTSLRKCSESWIVGLRFTELCSIFS